MSEAQAAAPAAAEQTKPSERELAIQHITQSLHDYANTLPMSARLPFARYTQSCLDTINAKP